LAYSAQDWRGQPKLNLDGQRTPIRNGIHQSWWLLAERKRLLWRVCGGRSGWRFWAAKEVFWRTPS